MVDISGEPLRCNHPVRNWVLASTGEMYWAPHPRLRGKEWAILADDWDRRNIGDVSNVCKHYITRDAS
eukprot:8801372-Heterocapsa_arctica.AAC.1